MSTDAPARAGERIKRLVAIVAVFLLIGPPAGTLVFLLWNWHVAPRTTEAVQ